ncbi:autotransporter-associated beta strand repeat-containing protein [Frateuria soli]|uniref:two-partner secretion domain-containing protein n=1 Tax=Frateuria soli TaxID=1542730 RepID=UPI001E3F8D77|nr:autotransporter-associated beta strand repeat-containing protein [Frateuria soli]UGB39164.1 filamentous hemagglutinin N-terminal domain-containing protein [Frateuria soli]
MHTTRATSRKDSLASLRRKALPLSLSLLLCGALASGPARAAGGVARTTTPTGGTIVGGSGSILQDGANVVINQASDKLVLNWQSFNLGEDALVRFNQPGSSAIALNRILDQNPSQIFGQISSNGQVFLINTHGIIFGSTAQVNVGGLVASTLDLTPTDFLSNHFNLDAVGGGAGVVNHGTIAAASGGSVSLIGGSVANDGVILANYGRINLDGAEHAVLDFDGNGLINVQITGELKQRLDARAAVSNAGKLQADGGTVVLEAAAARDLFTHLVNNSGLIDAGAISHDGGVVRLVARGGDTTNSGSIDVSGTRGGSAQLLSDRNVALTGDIDASGTQGGGRIRVGGGAQGGEGLLHASTSTVGAGARLNADATQSGKGGSIVVWSDHDTQVAGQFSARGGVQGGDGGFVETSAEHVRIDDAAHVSTLAPQGRNGTWLIDPTDFTIGSGGDMTAAAVESALGSGNLTIQSTDGGTAGSGNIYVEDVLGWSANTLTLTALNDIDIDAAVTTTGTAGLVLNASTAIGAAPAIAGGRVNLADTLTLGGSGGLTVAGTVHSVSGTLDISGLSSGASIGGLDGNGLVNLGGNALTLSNADGGVFSGVIKGAGGSLVMAGGTQTLSGSNNYGGGTTLGGGVLTVAGDANLGKSTGGLTFNGGTLATSAAFTSARDIVMQGNGTVQAGAALTLSGTISGSGRLTKAGAGTLTLSGTNTYGGGTTISAGTLKVSSDANLGATTGGVTFNGGTLNNTAAFTSARAITLQGAGTLQTGANLTLSGVISGGGGLTKTGSSTLTLSGIETYTGATDIAAGTLVLSGAGSVASSSGVTADGTFDISGTTAGASIASLAGSGTVTLGSKTLTLSNASGSFGGVIGGTGGLTLAGGSQTLSGVNTYSGATSISAGTLMLSGAGSVAGSSGVAANGTFDISGTTGATIASLGGSGTVTLGSKTLTLSNASGSFGGVIGGTGGLTLAGGNQTLGGINTYTGNTTLEGGVLTVSSDANLGGAAGDLVFDGGTLAISSAFTSARDIILQGNGTLQTGANLGLSGVISGSGDLAKTGSSKLTLSGINTYTGATDVTAGTLALSGAGSLADSSGVTADGTFDISGATAGATIASLDGAGTVSLGGKTLTLSNASGTFDGVIGGSGGLTLAGGNETLTGANTYSGGTTISGGTLSISSNASLGATTGALTLDGGTLENTASLALDRTLALGTGGGTLQTGAGTNLTLSGAVSGTGGLAQTGTGSLTLGGDVTTGGSQSYGKVFLGNDVTLASSTGSVDFAGTVDNADATARALSVIANNGSIGFGGAVGGGANGRLAGLTTSSQSFSAGALAVGGNLSVTTTSGGITQGGAFLVGGNAGFDAGSNLISLTNAGNDFGGTVDLTGGATAIGDGNGLVLGTLATDSLTAISHGPLDLGSGSVTGNLKATSNDGAITQSGGLAVTGTSTLDAGANAITLNAAGNDFQGTVRLLNSGAYDVALDNGSHALSMGASTLGTGALSLAGNGITQSGSIVQAAGAGAVNLQAGGGALVLADSSNDFTGAVSAQGAGISLQTLGDLRVAALDAGTDGSVSLVAGGTLDLAALGAIDTGNGDLTLGAGGSFTTSADLSGRNVSLRGDGGLILSNNVAASGTLDLTSSNATITQIGGTLVAAGATTVDAGTGSIGLTAGTNDFQGDVTLTGGATTINDANQLTLAAQDTGDLSVTSHGNLVLGEGTVNGVLTAGSSGGTISQASGGLTVTGTSSIDAGGGAITLTDGNNDFGDTVGLNGGAIAITDRNALTLGGLATGALSVSSHGNLALGASTITGTLDLASNGGDITQAGALSVTGVSTIDADSGLITLGLLNDFQDTVDLTGGDSVITDTNALALGILDTGALTVTSTGSLGLGSGSIGGDLTATSQGGAITQTGALAVQGISVLDAGAGAITLGSAANHFTGAVSLTGAGIALRDAGNLTVAALANQPDTGISLIAGGSLVLPAGAIDTGTADLVLAANGGTLGTTGALSGANVSLSGRDGLALADAVTATNTLTLASAVGDITQTAGALTAAHLTGSAGGTVLLGQVNAIGQLDGFSADGFTLLNNGNLTIAGPVAGGATGVDITSSSGLLSVAGDVSGGSIALQGVGISQSGGSIDAGSGQVSLQSGAGIAQTGGSITAGTLSGSTVGDASLAGANQVANLGSFSAANLSLTNAGGMTLAGPVTVTGAAALTVGGALAINNTLSAAATTLDVSGAITEGAGGNLATGTLSGQASGNVTLTRGNHVGTLGNFNATSFALANGQALTVNGNLGVGAGSIALTNTAGALSVNSALGGGSIALDSAADLVLGKAINATTLSLKSAGSISQTATGLITAGTLSGQSAGTTTLNQANAISALGNFSANGFSLTSTSALAVDGTVDGGAGIALATGGNLLVNGTLKGDATDLSAAGTIGEGASGNIAADMLTGQAGGAVTLNGPNHIGTLGNFQAAGFSLRDAQDLGISGTVDGGAGTSIDTAGNLVVSGIVKGSSTRLNVAGALSESGSGHIVADTLAGHVTGSASLTGNNTVGSLGNLDAAGLSFTNTGALAIAGTVDGGASTALTTRAGGLTIDGALAGTGTSLDIAGGIDQSSQGRITAGTLSGHAGGDVALDGDNRIDILGSFSARDFALSNGKAMAVNGPLTASGGNIGLATTAGTLSVNTALSGDAISLASVADLALGQAIHGGLVTLTSGGKISQTAGGLITADSLSGHSTGSTTLDQANSIGTLNGFGANGLTITTNRALTVTGTVDGGGSTVLTTGGNLAINGSLSGDTTRLTVTGNISEGGAGSITAHTLAGQATGAVVLNGANRLDTLGGFGAAGFTLSNGPSLTVTGALDGGASVDLTITRGDLLINGRISSKAATLVSSGAITEGQGGSIVADTLSGRAGGFTQLGTATSPLANYIGTLGGFSSTAGFSLTNAQTLTLASVGGSAYTVDAGTASLYLGVTGGDLLQIGKTWLYDGKGAFSSTGRIGTSDAPIYVTGTGPQEVALVGMPPAYFYAVSASGNLLPLTGGSSVNVPTSLFTSRAQNANNHTDVYIDPSVISANYRSFGIVPSGILLPADQQACDPEMEECDE